MKLQRKVSRIFRQGISSLLLGTLFVGGVAAADVVPPNLAEPIQKEKFFDPDRFYITDSSDPAKPVVQPHFSLSHEKRENDLGLGFKQTTESLHGEAGGKLNFLGDISLTTFAKLPVYKKESVGSQRTADGVSNSELFKSTGRLSWRSELGVPVKKGVNLNFFYDNSTIGRVDKPGVEEREEKFGTRFIFKFE